MAKILLNGPTVFTVLPILNFKGAKILKGNLDSIPSPSVKIQIMALKICLRCKANIAGCFLKTNSLLTSPSNVLPYYVK